MESDKPLSLRSIDNTPGTSVKHGTRLVEAGSAISVSFFEVYPVERERLTVLPSAIRTKIRFLL
jgi:hypothetical protein